MPNEVARAVRWRVSIRWEAGVQDHLRARSAGHCPREALPARAAASRDRAAG
jgi:hypothetical protein